MALFIRALLLGALWLCASPQLSFAQSSGATYTVSPKLVNVVKPIYPAQSSNNGDEAWLTIRLKVLADGTPTDIKIIDGFYSRPFENAALDAVGKWRFEPATENGKPVVWDAFDVNIPFVFTDIPGGAYPTFTSNYSMLDALLKQQDYAAAKSKIDEMMANHVVRLLYEYAFIEIALYKAEIGLGHDQAALKAIRHATPVMGISVREPQVPEIGTRIPTRIQLPKDGLLPAEPLEVALRYRFVIENKLGQYIDALETYDRLAKLARFGPEDPFTKQADAIRAAFASPQPLAVPAKIEGGSWSYNPSRRTFTLIDIKGSISSLQVVCDRRVATLPYQADVEWTLPPSWGDCELDVRGTDGTEFTLVEFKDAAPAASPSPTASPASPPAARPFVPPQYWTADPPVPAKN